MTQPRVGVSKSPGRCPAGWPGGMTEFAIRDCAALAEIKHITPQSTHSTTLWTLAWQTRRGVDAAPPVDTRTRHPGLTAMHLASDHFRSDHSALPSARVEGALAPRATGARSGRSGCA